MSVSPNDIRQFEQRARAMQKGASALSNDAGTEVKKIVDERRRKIKELMDHYPEGEKLPAADVPRLNAQIQTNVDALVAEVAAAVRVAQEAVWTKGVAAGRELALSLGIEGVLVTPPVDLLNVATNYSADLVKSISADVMPKVNGVLSRAALGGLSPYKAMQEIDALLGRAGQQGVSYQAERIVRTEVNRIYSIALDQQIQTLLGSVEHPEALKKEWVSGPYRRGRREDHQAIDGQQVPVTEDFVLPDGTRLAYPRDPAGPPHQTINCGCGWRIAPESLSAAMG